jgi:hypothetical protein
MHLKPTLAMAALLLTSSVALATERADDRADAMQALTDSNFEQAVALYSELVEADGSDGESRYRLGIALMSVDRLDEAASQFEAASELGYQSMGADYRLARIYARQGDEKQALAKLEAIADAGFPSITLIEDEPDFAPLHGTSAYTTALATIKSNRYPCRTAEQHRGFDFWVGSWDVTSAGQTAGESDVKLILGDCVVFENWESAAGMSGKSFNFYDAGHGHWRQIWVDDTGSVIEFTGQIVDGEMHYTATTRDPDSGQETRHKLTFSENEDGTVRQLWEQSTGEDAQWQVAFDGRYARQPAAQVSGNF